MRPRFDADIIAALRGRVIAHNEACPAARTRLQDLKKIYGRAWRGSNPEARAMEAVDRHLALRKAEFEEHEHPRDRDGRFQSKGGARDRYADVRTPAQHQRLMRDNAGYRAQQTDIIPETRYAAYLPTAMAGVAAPLAAIGGAFPEGKDYFTEHGVRPVLRSIAEGAGQVVGRVGGALTAGTISAAQHGFNAIRPRGVPAIPTMSAERAERIVDAAGNTLGGAARWVTDKALHGYQSANSWINQAIVSNAAGPMPQGDDWRARLGRLKRQANGRMFGAIWGVANPTGGLAMIGGAYKLGEYLGPMLDAYEPRRIEKIESPEIEALLAKAGEGADAEALTKAAAALASQAGKYAGEAVARFGRQFDAVFRRKAVPFGPVSQALGTLLGAGAGAGAAYGGATLAGVKDAAPGEHKGNPYRDEKGRFTSKERAVATGLGAGIGGLAALLAMRHGNRKAALAFLDRFSLKEGRVKDRAVQIARAADPTREKRLAAVQAAEKAALDQFEATLADKTGLGWIEHQLSQVRNQRLSDLLRGKGQHGRDFVALHPSQAGTAEEAAKYRDQLRAAAAKLIDGTEPGIDKLLTPEQKAIWDDVIRRVEGKRTDARERIGGYFGLGRKLEDEQQALGERIVAAKDKATERLGHLNELQSEINEFIDSRTGMTAPAQRKKLNELGARFEAITGRKSALAGKPVEQDVSALLVQMNKETVATRKAAAKIEEELGEQRSALDAKLKEWERQANRIKAGTQGEGAMPEELRVEHPFEPGKFLPHRPTLAEIDETKRAIKARHTGAFEARDKEKTDAVRAAAAERFQGLLADRRGKAPAVVPLPRFVDMAYSGAMRHLGPNLTAAQRDVLRALSAAQDASVLPSVADARAFLFGRPATTANGKTIEAIPNIAERAMNAAAQFRDWVRQHGGKLTAVAGLGASLGVLDYGADGKLDFKGFDKLLSPDAMPQRYFKILNAGRKDETVLWGATVRGKDGQLRFVYADAYRPRDKEWNDRWAREGGVTPSSPVSDIENVVRGNGNQTHGGSGGQNASIKVENDDDLKKINKAKSKVGHVVETERTSDDGAFSLQVRKGFKGNASKEDQQAILDGAHALLRSIRGNIKNAAGAKEKLALALSGDHNAGQLLDKEMRAGLLVGREANGQYQPGVMDKAVYDAFKARDGAKLKTAVESWVRGDGQGADPDRVIKALHLLNHAIGRPIKKADLDSAASSIRGAQPKMIVPPAAAAGAGGAAAPRAEPKGGEPLSWEDRRVPREILDDLYNKHADSIRELQNPFREAGVEISPKVIRDNLLTEMRVAFEFHTNERDSEAKRWQDARKLVEADINEGKVFWTKEAADRPAALRKVFDESQVRRNPKGADNGGQFAPEGGARAGAPTAAPRAPADDRSFFEPVRFLGTTGSTAAMQVAWDIADRVLPPAVRLPGKVLRLGTQLAASILGGAGGQEVGEAAARLGYKAIGKEPPPSYEPPERPAGEEVSRTLGNVGGWMAGHKFGTGYGTKLVASIGAAMAAEEAAGAVHRFIADSYGEDIAKTVGRYL